MTEYMDSRFEVSSCDLRVPTSGGFGGTAVPASARAFADGPALGSVSGARGGELLGAGHGDALRQRVVIGDALTQNPPFSGLPPVLRQVLTS
ncbi:hypothetical protein ACUN7V_18245 [Quadrisphaera oryzae]|uniref:hypothetical protein n=1 Tax=Quadrisphaera TaxID=317661 RepID=UPI0016492CE7|nr:hypothetical protein [Quadrisphaera sp. RL12-1S]MBC3761430.1 hypothetical protein [Quadrisphaera sp. RL12-1S]